MINQFQGERQPELNSNSMTRSNLDRTVMRSSSRTLARTLANTEVMTRSRSTTIPSQPAQPKIALSPLTDSGILGDFKTRFDRISLVGETTPNTLVILRDRGRVARSNRTRSDDNGRFEFANVPLQLGRNRLVLQAQAPGEDRSLFRQQVQRVASDDHLNPVLRWNGIALRAVIAAGQGSPLASRNLAIVHAAIYDAIAATDPTLSSYRFRQPLAAGTSQNLTAIAAAHRVLSELYPNQRSTFDTERQRSIATVDSTERPSAILRTAAIDWGEIVANQYLNARQNDGSNAIVNDTVNTTPGKWRPNPPSFRAAAVPQWATVTPFVMTSNAQFRPIAPPALTSRRYATELNQVKRLGALDSQQRTPEQTEIAKFWAVSSPLHWNQITEQLLVSDRPTLKPQQSTAQIARTFALLNFALADAAIAAWDAKYTYNTWRPITAIRLDGDRNPRTQRQPDWNPLLSTPNHPDYVSAHSTFSGAASTVLGNLFGDRLTLTTGSVGLPGSRSYRSFSQAANEVGISRIYGGIHTQSANLAGLRAGRRLGRYVMQTSLS